MTFESLSVYSDTKNIHLKLEENNIAKASGVQDHHSQDLSINISVSTHTYVQYRNNHHHPVGPTELAYALQYLI